MIFNFAKDKDKIREGSERDADNLRRTFDMFNFDVVEIKDSDRMDFNRKIQEFIRLLNTEPVSCLVVCILSHGAEGK